MQRTESNKQDKGKKDRKKHKQRLTTLHRIREFLGPDTSCLTVFVVFLSASSIFQEKERYSSATTSSLHIISESLIIPSSAAM
jgi:hypothetical protein